MDEFSQVTQATQLVQPPKLEKPGSIKVLQWIYLILGMLGLVWSQFGFSEFSTLREIYYRIGGTTPLGFVPAGGPGILELLTNIFMLGFTVPGIFALIISLVFWKLRLNFIPIARIALFVLIGFNLLAFISVLYQMFGLSPERYAALTEGFGGLVVAFGFFIAFIGHVPILILNLISLAILKKISRKPNS